MTINMINATNTKSIPKKISLLQRIALILFGLFLTIVILEIGLRIVGFTILSIQEYRNLQSIKQKGAYRIMCLGESTTQNQYPPYLEDILNESNIGIKFTVIDKGLTGTNTVVILSKLEANLDKYNPDIVVTMMGSNDRGTIYYKDISESNTGLFQHCRAYRFGWLIYMHILNKLKKKGIYRSNISSFNRKAKSKKIETIGDKTIEPNPNSDIAYSQLGKLYRAQGKFAEAEQLFKKAIELNPNSDSAYEGLAQLYKDQEKFIESEQAFKKAIELNPNSDSAYKELGWLYGGQGHGKFAEAEQLFKKAIELNPNNETAYMDLSRFYINYQNFAKPEQLFKKAIELNPNNDSVYEGLGQFYKYQGKFIESEQAFKKAIELNPKNDSAYGGLAAIYYEIGNNELSKVYAEKANSIRREYYSLLTVNNYHTLKQILDKRKIKLVCVQYPMRNIEPLEKMFEKEIKGSIIFVDNERIFKDAIKKEGYKEYFIDMFGGDFGHCTPKGNKLLAENIANTILKEIFNK